MTMMKIKAADMWQTTHLDHAIAEEFFGWQWWSYVGRPTRGHPEYNSETLRVREFFPPEAFKGKQWKEFFDKYDGRKADGNEPLSYRYCSSVGPAMVPHFEGHPQAFSAVEIELKKRKLLPKYIEILAGQIDCEPTDTAALMLAGLKDRCIAALATIGSKYVVKDVAEVSH